MLSPVCVVRSARVRSRASAAFCLAAVLGAAAAPGDSFSGKYTGGLIIQASRRAALRHLSAPFDDPKFVLSDVTFQYKRRFTRYSGDVSGRYLSAVSFLFAPQPFRSVPHLEEILKGILKAQKPDGHFGVGQNLAAGVKRERDMPLVWGNGRLLVGLVELYTATGRKEALEAARRLADYFISAEKYYGRKENFLQVGGTFASGFATCYLSLIEGLELLGREVPEGRKYHLLAGRIARLLKEGPSFPGFHAHGRLTAYRGLLLSGSSKDFEFVLARWNKITREGYVMPNGSIGEVFSRKPVRDEGCAEADWLRLNLQLFARTGRPEFLDAAEAVLLNEILASQFPNGGFGHQRFLYQGGGSAESEPPVGFRAGGSEAYWCCSSHVGRALGALAAEPWIKTPGGLCLPFLFPAEGRFDIKGNNVSISLRKADPLPGVAGKWTVEIKTDRPVELRILIRRPYGCVVKGLRTGGLRLPGGGWIKLPDTLQSCKLGFEVIPGLTLGKDGRTPRYGPYLVFLPAAGTGFGAKAPCAPQVLGPSRTPSGVWNGKEHVWFNVPLRVTGEGRPYLELQVKSGAMVRKPAFLLLPWRCNEGGFFRFAPSGEVAAGESTLEPGTTMPAPPKRFLVFYSSGSSQVFVNGVFAFSYMSPDEAYRFPLPSEAKELAVVSRASKGRIPALAAYVEEVDRRKAARSVLLATGSGRFRAASGRVEGSDWMTKPPAGTAWKPAEVVGEFGDSRFGRTAGALAGTGARWIWGEKGTAVVCFRSTIP